MNRRSEATRGGGTAPMSSCAMARQRGPDTRTMPMPARPAAVAIAAMVATASFKVALRDRSTPCSENSRCRQPPVHRKLGELERPGALLGPRVVADDRAVGFAEPRLHEFRLARCERSRREERDV